LRQLAENRLSHHNSSVIVIKKMQYDHAGRVLKIFQNVNNAAADQLVAQYEYNALGQLVDKKLHNTGSTSFLQSVDYRYTIRGWIKSINNAGLNVNSANNDESTDYFGMEFLYDLVDSGIKNTAFYNGSISAVKWKGPGAVAGLAEQNAYKYTYDKSERMTTAVSMRNSSSGWTQRLNTLNESATYDLNGNIKTLQRNHGLYQLSGTTVSHVSETMDNLTYTYSATQGNQLIKVTDAVPLAIGRNDFKDNANLTTEYTYNNNGALTMDSNKGIDSVHYNVLGKVRRVKFSNGAVITYFYDASGNKIKMKTISGGTIKVTDYVGPFVYHDENLSFFASPEGRVVKKGSTFEYQYAIGDNQGNTRVVFSSVKPATVAPVANFEGTTSDKTSEYLNVDPNHVVSFPAANHTSGGSMVVRMNQNYKVGPAKSIKVFPGDKIAMEVWEYHEGSSGFGTSSTPLTTLVSMVSGAFGGVNGAPGDPGLIYNGVETAVNAFLPGGNLGESRPAAYLNYILFDKHYNLLDMGWVPAPGTTFTKQKLSFPTKTIKEAGYMFVYLSYDNDSNNWVFFDDFKVTHTKTNVIQYNEYYPFGLQTASSWTRDEATDNAYLYNGGSELNATTSWYETFFRGYDATLGRFLQVDPLAHQASSFTPYNYAFNNPVMFNDPMGDYPSWVPQTWDDAARWKAGGGINVSGYRGPGSGRHWSDGSGYSDWSYSGGSDLYRQGLLLKAAGAPITYQGGTWAGFGGVEVDVRNGTFGYWTQSNSVDYEYYVGNDGRLRRKGTVVVTASFVSLQRQAGQGDPDPWKNTKAALGIAVITSAADGPIPAGEIVGAAIIIGAFAWDLVRPVEQGNSNYPGPWSYTKPDPTIPFYNSSGNSSYEPPDPGDLPPGIGIGVGGTLGGLMLLQDYLERKEGLKQVPVQQDATKYVIPRLGPR
jgi:RHS repeat-associated protein